MKYILLIFFAAVLLPGLVHADIHITEIAWMGTENSQYSEWLELYNDSGDAVNLAGWKLYGNENSLIYTFTKTIAPSAYLLLERTTSSAPDAVPGIDDESGSFGGEGLANTGEDLALKDANGTTVESLDFASGWPAGDATTKETMQWNGAAWITAVATPDAPAPSGVQNTTPTQQAPKSNAPDLYPIPKVSPNIPHIEFTIPDVVYSGIPNQFKAQPVLAYNYRIDPGNYYWNMGDGTVYRQNSAAGVTHTYRYPGTYTVFFSYSDPSDKNNFLSQTQKITVTAPALSIQTIDRNALEIKNNSASPINLTNWEVVLPEQKIQIPDMTIVAEQATIVIPFSMLSITTFPTTIALADPSGAIIASVANTPEVLGTSVRAAETPNITAGGIPAAENIHADPNPLVSEETTTPLKQNHTKSIIFGVVAFFVIVLSILLERFMARQEY